MRVLLLNIKSCGSIGEKIVTLAFENQEAFEVLFVITKKCRSWA